MLTVTESAKQILKDTLTVHGNDPEIGLRLLLKPLGRLGIVLDKETEGDEVVEHEGAKVLLISFDLAPLVDGNTLDVQDTPNGPQLTMFQESRG